MTTTEKDHLPRCEFECPNCQKKQVRVWPNVDHNYCNYCQEDMGKADPEKWVNN
jgi:hypothetical protein